MYASSPESLGISSSAILNFIDKIDSEQICIHGFLLLRKGKVVSEGYWAPYSRESMHRMYSVSKSIVSLAVGLMIDEGKLNLDDKVVQFFEDKVPQNIHPYLEQTTIRDLLMMAAPHSTKTYTPFDSDWAKTFFDKMPSYPPGTIFSYNTVATVILSTIIERISRVTFLEYMRDKLLDPIGFSKDAWCIKTPEGTSWGGSGVICTLRDMVKLAYVTMNKGRWNDLQLISEEYITAATSKQIDNSISGNHGYGYQMWIEKEKGFSFRALGSQFAFCFPEKELIFACIADTQGYTTGPGISEIFYNEIFSKIKDSPLPDDVELNIALNKRIESLKILPQQGSLTSSYEQRINNKWFTLDENLMGIKKMRLVLNGDKGIWEYENLSGYHQLEFGIGEMISGVFPEENYYGDRIGSISGRSYDCLSSAAWVEEHKLNMLVYITDNYLGNLKISFSFKENEISIYMTKAAEWFLDEYMGVSGGVLAE